MKKLDVIGIANEYQTKTRLIQENIINSMKRSVKTRDFNRMKRIKSPFVEDCFVLTTSDRYTGTIFIKVDGKWVFNSERVDIEGKVFECFNIISEHCIERFRCRLNMYATPIEDVLKRFEESYLNGKSFSTTTDRLGQCVYIDTYNVVCPVEYTYYNGNTSLVCIIKTVLDQPDRKTDEVRGRQDSILEKMASVA